VRACLTGWLAAARCSCHLPLLLAPLVMHSAMLWHCPAACPTSAPRLPSSDAPRLLSLFVRLCCSKEDLNSLPDQLNSARSTEERLK
jgi:hypothetical protein